VSLTPTTQKALLSTLNRGGAGVLNHKLFPDAGKEPELEAPEKETNATCRVYMGLNPRELGLPFLFVRACNP